MAMPESHSKIIRHTCEKMPSMRRKAHQNRPNTDLDIKMSI